MTERPLLYFLKECDHMLDVYVDTDFVSQDDLDVFGKNVADIPRTSEYIWIYQKLTEYCKKVNDENYKFQISGFGCNLYKPECGEYWFLSIGRGEKSTNKLNVVICTGAATLHMNHGDYQLDLQSGSIAIFPAYLWWKVSGDILACTLSGNHFM